MIGLGTHLSMKDYWYELLKLSTEDDGRLHSLIFPSFISYSDTTNHKKWREGYSLIGIRELVGYSIACRKTTYANLFVSQTRYFILMNPSDGSGSTFLMLSKVLGKGVSMAFPTVIEFSSLYGVTALNLLISYCPMVAQSIFIPDDTSDLILDNCDRSEHLNLPEGLRDRWEVLEVALSLIHTHIPTN